MHVFTEVIRLKILFLFMIFGVKEILNIFLPSFFSINGFLDILIKPSIDFFLIVCLGGLIFISFAGAAQMRAALKYFQSDMLNPILYQIHFQHYHRRYLY